MLNLSEALDAIVDLILECQDRYEVYFGTNAYVLAYAQKLKRAREVIAAVEKRAWSGRVSAKLAALRQSWDAPATWVAQESVDEDEECDQDGWVAVVSALSPQRLRSEGAQAREVLLGALRHYLRRRRALARLLESRFPLFSQVDHLVELLLHDARIVQDAAVALSEHLRVFVQWLEQEEAALDAVRQAFAANQFKVDEAVTRVKMDECKERANGLCIAYVALARRLGASRTDHLAVRWAV